MLRRCGTPCPRCIGGQMYTDPDWLEPFAALTCLQCGHIEHYIERDGTIQPAALPAHIWQAEMILRQSCAPRDEVA